MKADEYITVEYEDTHEKQNIAYEIRYSHPKSKQDVETYAKNNINVLECNVNISTPDSISKMKTRLLGKDNINNRMPYLEWLYYADYDENQKP